VPFPLIYSIYLQQHPFFFLGAAFFFFATFFTAFFFAISPPFKYILHKTNKKARGIFLFLIIGHINSQFLSRVSFPV